VVRRHKKNERMTAIKNLRDVIIIIVIITVQQLQQPFTDSGHGPLNLDSREGCALVVIFTSVKQRLFALVYK